MPLPAPWKCQGHGTICLSATNKAGLQPTGVKIQHSAYGVSKCHKQSYNVACSYQMKQRVTFMYSTKVKDAWNLAPLRLQTSLSGEQKIEMTI